MGIKSQSAEATRYAADQSVRGQESTNATNKQINDATNQANLNLATQQNEWNLEQWNRENVYNSPSEQLKRLQEAGLNPLMVQGGLSSGTASHLESADLANQKPYEVQNPYGSDYVAAMNKTGEIKQQQISQAFAIGADTLKNAQNFYFQMQRLNLDKSMANYQKEMVKALTQGYLSDNLLKDKNLKYSDSQYNAQLRNLDASTRLHVAQANDISAQTNAKKANIEASTNKMNSETRLNEIESKWREQKLSTEIKKMYVEMNYTDKLATTADSVLPYIIAGHKLDNHQKELLNTLSEQEITKFGETLRNLQLTNDAIQVGIDQDKFDLNLDKQFKWTERFESGMESQSRTFLNVSNIIKNLKPW